MRTFISAEKEKSINTKKIYRLEDDCQNLEDSIKELEKTLEEKKIQDKIEHDKIVNQQRILEKMNPIFY